MAMTLYFAATQPAENTFNNSWYTFTRITCGGSTAKVNMNVCVCLIGCTHSYQISLICPYKPFTRLWGVCSLHILCIATGAILFLLQMLWPTTVRVLDIVPLLFVVHGMLRLLSSTLFQIISVSMGQTLMEIHQ